MAAKTSFFLAAAIRRCCSGSSPPNPTTRSRPPNPTTRLRYIIPFFLAQRPLTTGALPAGPSGTEEPSPAEEDDLRSMIFRLRFPKRSATDALQRWVGKGNKPTAPELRRIGRDLRRAQRYKHALEICEWLITHQKDELSDSDYAVRIDLIDKVFGTVAAEEFFEGLPSTAKNCETYTALLHAYAGAKLVEKAESLFDRIKESSITLSTLIYNEMMTLYISVGQADKVALVIEELKNSSVSPDLFTYNLWVSACASTVDFDGVRRILAEMCCDPNCDSGWKIYIKLTDIYISASHLTNTKNSLVEAEKITEREWITYDFLIILYTGLGNKERINEIWKSLRMASQKMSSRSYVSIISSYLVLGHLKEARDILDEWTRVKGLESDISVFSSLYDAFLKADLMPVAENLHKLMLEKNHEPGKEILTWMESHGSFTILAHDYALKLDLITEVHGLPDAEAYYQKIHDSASLKAASLTLLHHYVKERHVEQAETLMVKLQDLGVSNPLPFNEMMKLYMATGQYNKVPIVIQQMKCNMIPRNVLSYNIWLDACSEVSGISSVEKVYDEMVNDKSVVVGWSTYATLANIYTKHDLTMKACIALKAAEERLSTRNRLGFFFLITLYAALNARDDILRLWKYSKNVAGRVTCANYMCIILCLVKVGDFEEAEKVFNTWESESRKYDIRVSNVLLGAYVRKGWMDKAESLHFHTLGKGGKPNYKTWEILIEGWVKSKEMNKAVEAMKKGFSLMKFCAWRPSHEVLLCIMEYFEEQGNADDAWRCVKVLHRYKLMTLPLYKSYLRACVHAQRPAPNILKMTGKDEVVLDEEASILIQCVNNVDRYSIGSADP